MRMSDLVAEYILRMLDESNGNAEIQRNVLASELGCVPSQINYVITSRFTPEQGYIVESRRGGGGYVRITRVATDKRSTIMHIINSIGDKLSAGSVTVMLRNMQDSGILSRYDAALIGSALSDKAYGNIPQQFRDSLRASIFKNMLITYMIRKD